MKEMVCSNCHSATIHTDDCEGAKYYGHYMTKCSSLRAELEGVKGENICPFCAGSGKPVSGLPCSCKGTGRASDAIPNLLSRIYDVEKELEDAKGKLCRAKGALEFVRILTRHACEKRFVHKFDPPSKPLPKEDCGACRVEEALSSLSACRHAGLEEVAKEILKRTAQEYSSLTYVGRDYTLLNLRNDLLRALQEKENT